jgi:hypothetical protein
MRTRLTMSALVALLGAVVAVAGNSTVANAETSAPAAVSAVSLAVLGDAYCC